MSEIRGKPHDIDGALEAWLTFLTRDDLESVPEPVDRHREFADIYIDIAGFRMERNRRRSKTGGLRDK